MDAQSDSIEVTREVDARARPLLVAVGGQGWRELARERTRARRVRLLRVALWGFAVGFAIGALSSVPR